MIPFSFDIVYRTPNQTAVYGIDALIRSWLRRHIDKYGDVDQQLKVGIGEPFTIFGIRTVSITNWDIESPLLPHVKTGAVTPVMAVKSDGTQQCLSLLPADGEYTDIIPLTAELNGIRMALKLPVHDQGYSMATKSGCRSEHLSTCSPRLKIYVPASTDFSTIAPLTMAVLR